MIPKRLSISIAMTVLGLALLVFPAHATRPCNYEEFHPELIRNLLKGLFVKMDANGVPYTKEEANLRRRYLGEARDPRLGGRVFVEELSYRAGNGDWYALHNVVVKTGNAVIDAAPFKVAFAEPYTKKYLRVDQTTDLTCVVGLAEGSAIDRFAFQVWNTSRGGTHVADILPSEIDDFLPAAYPLMKVP